MRLPEIIGISGTNGSGKDTLAALRAEKENAMHVTLSDILRDHLRQQGLPCERKNLADLSREWRETHDDNAILVNKTIERYFGEKALKAYNGLSIVSLRHPDEARRIIEFGGRILWVDADPEIRYQRVQAGQRNREDDNKTFEEFMVEQDRELHPQGILSPGTVNLGAVKELVNKKDEIVNNFPTEAEYIAHLTERFEIG